MDIPHIPDYELLAMIACSRLTCSFAARHRSGGFACVIKVLQPHFAADPLAIDELTREARIGLAVRHPHVVKLLDAQIHQPPYYVVRQPVTGKPLSTCLEFGPLGWSNSIRLAHQIAGGVKAIHRIGFVHGDICAENVIVRSDGAGILTGLGEAHQPIDEIGCTFASDWQAFGLLLADLFAGMQQQSHVLAIRQKTTSTTWPPRLSELVDRLTAMRPEDQPFGAVVMDELQKLDGAVLAGSA